MYAKDTPSLSIRAKQDLIDKLTDKAGIIGISRSQIINRALEFYVDTKECYFCRELNNGKGAVCSVCKTPFYSFDEIRTAIRAFMDDYIEKNGLPKNGASENGITHRYIVGASTIGGRVYYDISYQIVTESGDVFVPVSNNGGTDIYEVDKEALKLYLSGAPLPGNLSNYVHELKRCKMCGGILHLEDRYVCPGCGRALNPEIRETIDKIEDWYINERKESGE